MMELMKDKDTFEGLSLLACLEKVEDPRIDRKKLHPLSEILLIALCALLSGFESFCAFEIYGNEKITFLRRFYPFENGVPSHDTFARVFTLLDPKQFSKILELWVSHLRAHLVGDKTTREFMLLKHSLLTCGWF